MLLMLVTYSTNKVHVQGRANISEGTINFSETFKYSVWWNEYCGRPNITWLVENII